MRTRMACVVAAFVAGLSIVGCSSDKTAEQVGAMNKSNIQRISNMYAAFQNMKSGGGPKDEAELKTWIREYAPDKLAMMKIDANNIEGLFISERDNKPFKIRYKVGGGRGSVAPVVFETDGVGGKKQVGFTGGKVEEVDDAEYKLLWEGKSGSTSPTAGSGGGKDAGRPKGGAPAGAPKGPPGK